MKKLSLKEKMFYCFGSFGMGAVTATHMMFLVWFFIHDTGADLPYYIEQKPVFWVFTIMGLLLALRTIFDAISDPIIGNISDKINPKKGARTTLLTISAIPFAISYFMVFLVPKEYISSANVIWIAIWLVICTLFLTIYSVNHEALMAKIAKKSNDRIDLGTFASASWFVGLVLVMVSSNLWGPIQNVFSVDKVTSIKITFGIAAALGGLCMIVPGLFIKEKKFEDKYVKKVEKVKIIPSLIKTMKYPNFRKFVLANTLYASATVIFESGLMFFVTVLAVLSEGVAGTLTTVIGAVTLGMYPIINKLTKTKGRKFVLLASFISYIVTFVAISIMSPNPNPWLYLGIILLVAPFSQAGFGILPVIIASDNADHMIRHTGEDMTGMYMATSGFFRKLGSTIALVALTSFLVLGKEVGDDLGIRVAVYFAAALSLIGFFIMKGYNEKEVMSNKELEQIQE